mgnify:CR=1 FL=1
MRVHVIYAHPVETSFNGALFRTTCDGLAQAGHVVDALDLYGEAFQAAMSREERLNYHNVPGNLTAMTKPYVDRLKAADALIFVHPVWNYGYPSILKGYFDRIFLPGVTFTLEHGDHGKLAPALNNIRKAAFITTYGSDRLHSWLMGDPPRRLALRWAWATLRTRPNYYALYDMNNAGREKCEAFLAKVRKAMARF